MRNWWQLFKDHLTKVLGIIGTALMALFLIDPASIYAAAEQYLGQKPSAKIGAVLFALVVLRGWYTGWKAKQK